MIYVIILFFMCCLFIYIGVCVFVYSYGYYCECIAKYVDIYSIVYIWLVYLNPWTTLSLMTNSG